jgi:putative transposase
MANAIPSGGRWIETARCWILVQRPREKEAVKKFFRKLLKGWRYVRRATVTDQLKGHGATDREMLPGLEPW